MKLYGRKDSLKIFKVKITAKMESKIDESLNKNKSKSNFEKKSLQGAYRVLLLGTL